jgi:FkbM family methyltransferase
LPKTEKHLLGIMFGREMHVRDGKVTYQHRKLAKAMEYVPQDRRRVAVDIGGHVGLWSMWMVQDFQQVRAFEPMPYLAEAYRFNVPGNNWILHQNALGNHMGTVTMDLTTDNTGNTHVKAEGGTTPLYTLDSFKFKDVDFIKIDVEGYEQSVIEGALETIQRCRPVMVVEQKGRDAAYFKTKLHGATAILHDLGMKSVHVIGGDHILVWQ